MDFYRMIRCTAPVYPVVNRQICYSTNREDYHGRMIVCKRATMSGDQNKRGNRARRESAFINAD